ncbi:MAG: hypothetical protein GX326_03130 [Clostridiaceae bacterium]|nr:hypothetical protein [Clostridiaceae bacterium]
MNQIRFKLPAYFQDNMILQQGVSNRIYGLTKPNTELTVNLERFPASQPDSPNVKKEEQQQNVLKDFGLIFTNKLITDQRGFFDISLPAFEASKDHYQLTLTVEKQSFTIKKIYFGEVWLALGEGNMTMPVKYSDIKNKLQTYLKFPYLRFFTMERSGLLAGESYSQRPTAKIANGKWQSVNSETTNNLSAIALAFAARLNKSLNIPVAIYDLGCPNTMIHSWLSRDIVDENPIIREHVENIFHYRDASTWNKDLFNSEINLRSANTDNLPEDYPDMSFNQIEKFSYKNQPGAMYNHKIAPFSGLSIKGIILAHGESDILYPKYFLEAFKEFSKLLKESFHSFKRGPYLIYSQLAPHYYTNKDDKLLPYFNEVLTVARRQLAMPAGMVTVYDLPLDYIKDENHMYASPLHPIAKEAVGERMYQLAKGLVYQANSPKSAPEVKYAEWIENKLILSFANVGEGLDIPKGELTLKGFHISSDSTPYVTAEANKLYGIRTLIWHEEILQPNSCTYAFTAFNQSANLKGHNGLPVVPFRLANERPYFSLSNDWMSCDRLKGWVVPTEEKYRYNLPDKRKPGYFPLWKITGGKSTLKLEKDNKITGAASIILNYNKAENEQIILEPILYYASLYPPLNFSYWQNLEVNLFNADHKTKTISLKIIDTDGNEDRTERFLIEDVLVWQNITFDLQRLNVNLGQIKQLQFMIESRDNEGELTIDSITCSGIIEE